MLALTSSTRTIYHGWPAGAKLAAVAAGVFALQFVQWPVALAAAAGAVALAYLLCGTRFFAEGLRMMRPLWFFVAVVLAWHAIDGAPVTGVEVALRLVAAVGLANLATMTSRLDDLIDVVLWLLSPLRRIGVDPAPIGFATALAIRFTPVLLAKAGTLVEAWRARSARAPGWRVVLPITLLAIDDAEQVAEAVRARGGIGASPPAGAGK